MKYMHRVALLVHLVSFVSFPGKTIEFIEKCVGHRISMLFFSCLSAPFLAMINI
jgi:hypothetical protein